ncbi:MAG: response regulator [Holophagales bacterium]|nr:response regulator [Holophagales bacterium]
MKPLRVVVVDDEELARAVVREHLAAHPGIEIVAECANGIEAIEAVAALAPDLVFLDVQMPRLTGFETLELLDPRPAVVFVTAYDRHAVKAFEVSAVDYLLKPFSKERFDAALAKARALLGSGAKGPDPATLAAAARPEGASLERIAVREGTRVTLLPVETVAWVKAEDDYVLIRSGGKNHLKHQTLSDLATRLPAARFVRVHRSWVVNVGKLASLEEGKTAVMADGERVPVSRAGAARLRERMPRG